MKIGIEDKKIIKRILYLFKPHKKKVVLILACMLASAGVSMLIPRVSQQLMDRGLLAHNYKLLVMFTLANLGLL
ncbi:MAG TPA: ABC transporter ATP-binding protein, partial [Bacillota bacterium]|nr:ABC transporter ATP-binding protein [Bacillota bacterium]